MNEHQDEFTAYHDKPKGSNNPAIYTALADIMGLPMDVFLIQEMFHQCFINMGVFWRVGRTPTNLDKLSSRDEILGWFHLGFLSYENLEKHNFRYEHQWIKVNPFKMIMGFIKIAGKDRNFAHENNIESVYPIMFWLPWHDQHYIKKVANKKTTMMSSILFFIYFLSTITKPNFKNSEKQTGNISAKNILWMQLVDMKSKYLIQFIDHEQNLSDYFGDGHPISEAVNG
jgi:hypothetical protein